MSEPSILLYQVVITMHDADTLHFSTGHTKRVCTSNYKIKPSSATTILCSLQSRHVSALTSGHLQAILVILNSKIEVTIHYNGSVESNGIYMGKMAVVYVKVAK
jgi:hypothetical protein